jgi:ABC-type sugar transport system ATPase subunit
LEIRAGEIIAVTGALGSGKSNLLRALFGLAKFASGRAILDGAEWRPSGPAEAIARGVFLAGEDRWRSSLLPPETPWGRYCRDDRSASQAQMVSERRHLQATRTRFRATRN